MSTILSSVWYVSQKKKKKKKKKKLTRVVEALPPQLNPFRIGGKGETLSKS